MRVCGRCVRARGCASTCTVIPSIWGPLASLTAVVSVLFCGGIFCVAWCRALFDKPCLGESFMRLCGWCVRAGGCASTCAVIPRIRGQLASLAAVVSGLFCVGIFCVACYRALLNKPELRESFRRLCRRAAALQLGVRSHSAGMGALASLAVTVSIMFYVCVFLIACCRVLLDELGLAHAPCVCAVAQLLSTLSCAVPPRACRARVTLAKKIPTAFCVGGSCGAWCRVL